MIIRRDSIAMSPAAGGELGGEDLVEVMIREDDGIRRLVSRVGEE